MRPAGPTPIGAHDPAQIPLPKTFAPTAAAPKGFPERSITSNGDLFIGRAASADEAQKMLQAYYASISWTDWNVGRVVDELDRLGLRENTIIVFWGDHGYHLGEFGKWAKHGSLFELGTRVPLIIVAPGVAGGRVVPDNVSLIDIAPTILDLVKAPAAPTFEGRSLLRLMTGGTPPVPRSGVLSELEAMDPTRDWRVHSRALMSGVRKLVVRPNGNMFAFDLWRDPAERRAWLVLQRPNALNMDLVNALNEMTEELTKSASAERLRQPLDEATREKLRALGYAN